MGLLTTLCGGSSKIFAGLYNGTTTELAKQVDLDACFQSVSEGKSLIAAAVTDKGVPTAADDTFQVMANNINKIKMLEYTIYDVSNFKYTLSDFSHIKNPNPNTYCKRIVISSLPIFQYDFFHITGDITVEYYTSRYSSDFYIGIGNGVGSYTTGFSTGIKLLYIQLSQSSQTKQQSFDYWLRGDAWSSLYYNTSLFETNNNQYILDGPNLLKLSPSTSAGGPSNLDITLNVKLVGYIL